MARNRQLDESPYEVELVTLRLAAPEREVITTSRYVTDRELQDRVRKSPLREPILFNFEELEDLHRALAIDEVETDDKKRRKKIDKLLGKIEDLLEEEEVDAWAPDFDEGDELPIPTDARDFFDAMFCATVGDGRQAPPPCRLVLTPDQREMLRNMDAVSVDVHKMLAVSSPGECAFDFSPRQLLVVSLAVKEALQACPDDTSSQPFVEIIERISDGLLATIEDTAALDSNNPAHASPRAPAAVAYQLKITLEGSKPPIWRRVQVADCTLSELHEIVQVVMGWMNSHLHLFEYGKDRFSDPRFELDANEFDETQVYLSQLVDDGCQKLRYCYDFGDDWCHTIKIEKALEPRPADKFPRCLKGVGACPPEDVGGMWGYYEFLEAIRDPKHERHDEFVEWGGEGIDPSLFDVNEVNRRLAL